MIRSFCCSALLWLPCVSLQSAVYGQNPSEIVRPQVSKENAPRPRLRELGISIGILPTGPTNSITDVEGVQVGHRTIVEGDSIRTGVTAIKPHASNVFLNKVPAALHVANGFGKFTGISQIQELGVIETPIILTNTLSTFAVADALVGWSLGQPGCESVRSVNPIVGECNDGFLNDIRQRRVSAKDVIAALEIAHDGPVEEGCVGAGTGVRCMGWKGGIGSSSRRLPASLGGYTVGVLVQTNFGGTLAVAGVPVGRELGRYYLKDEVKTQEHGSCIVVVATDAPLDARRLQRLARRAPLGLAAVGSPISHGSGDYVIAFSTSEHLRVSYQSDAELQQSELLRDDRLSPLFQATRDATEEAVINSMLKAVATTGRQGRTAEAINPAQVAEICRKAGVLSAADGPSVTTDNESTMPRSVPRTYGGLQVSSVLRQRIDRFEERLPELMRDNHVPGVSLAVIEDRKLVWSRGYGVRCAGTRHPVQPDTVMEACSMSKPFYAYLFLKMVEQNTVDLNRPLVDYFAEDFIADDPRHRLITAEMVLTHTSGLPNWRQGGWRSGSPLSLLSDPGKEFRYSGEGFFLLQRAVEKLSGTDLDTFSRERLIKPMRLEHTRFVWDERLMVNAACGHDQHGKLKSDRNYYDRANAAFSLYTTAEDYARFVAEILSDDRSQTHSISSEMRSKMLMPISHREEQNADWGLGWGMRQLSDRKQVYHSGSNRSGFRCYSEFSPDTGDGMVIMTNAVNGKALWQTSIDDWHARGDR